jgi:hypothetical protein
MRGENMTVLEEVVVPPAESDTTDEAAICSPFALMHPDAAKRIVERAAALDLPSRRCSPLSNPRLGGSPMDEEAGGDFS